MKKLIIIGTNPLAEIANEYFTYDSDYSVVAFSVEKEFIEHDRFFNKPVVSFDKLEKLYPPQNYSVFVSLGYGHMNNDRTHIYLKAKEKGYKIASYLSSNAFVWRNVEIGEHCFIFENNTVQPFVKVGNNVIMWSGNHIGHHSIIKDNCFISSHVVISGLCTIGKNCFLGVNSTISNNLTIADNCIIGAGTNVINDLIESGTYVGNPARKI
uniref:Putative hexapeptide repeat-containing transferase n=1 Tax=viral metagenome TaxID=1070528 RepID=A0A6M3K9P5_9ZZZZ